MSTNAAIKQDILKYLDDNMDEHSVVRDLLGRLRSQINMSTPIRDTDLQGHRRGQGHEKRRARGRGQQKRGQGRGRGHKVRGRPKTNGRRKPSKEPAVYQRPFDGWI